MQPALQEWPAWRLPPVPVPGASESTRAACWGRARTVPPSSPPKGVSVCPGHPPAQSADGPLRALPLVLLDRQLFAHILFPTAASAPTPAPARKGAAKSLLKRGEESLRGSGCREASCLRAPCTQPRSPPVRRGPAGRDGHRLPLPGHPGLQRHCHCRGQFTCPLPPPSQESPSSTLVPGPSGWSVQVCRPGGSVPKGTSKWGGSWPLSRCGLGTIPDTGHHVAESGRPGGQTVEQREQVQVPAPWLQLREAERLLHRGRLALAGRGP